MLHASLNPSLTNVGRRSHESAVCWAVESVRSSPLPRAVIVQPYCDWSVRRSLQPSVRSPFALQRSPVSASSEVLAASVAA